MAAVAAISGLILGFGTTAAWADTSTATAQALTLTIGGGSVLSSGTESASNPGPAGDPAVINGDTPALSVLGTQSTVTAGVLVQTAIANGDGTSSACAGLVGAGGSIQIGTNGNCAVVGAATSGVTLNLPGLVTLTATAILEQCSANSSGTVTASAQLVDAQLNLAGNPAVVLPVNPTAGQTVSAFLLDLGLNDQSTSDGQITGTALSLSVLDTIDLNIGTVTCGPNAATSATSAFPVKSLPIAGGTLALLAMMGAVPWYIRRRRTEV
ncbi:MAG: hypothetical protein ACLPVF_04875 [Acidimicrobiales bacterium]